MFFNIICFLLFWCKASHSQFFVHGHFVQTKVDAACDDYLIISIILEEYKIFARDFWLRFYLCRCIKYYVFFCPLASVLKI